jgi:VWFA-related protein
MTAASAVRALAGTLLAVTVLGSAGSVPAQEPTQLPTFRGGATAVVVDVSVRDRNRRVVPNLTAADFQVLDNGVVQTVDSVTYGKVPIDVTVALDLSYSVTGLLLERLRRGVRDLMDDLKKEDRLKLMVFNHQVQRTFDFTSNVDEAEATLKKLTAGGSTSLLDALSVALVSRVTPDRRQLVVFFTDGADSTSVTPSSALTTVARRSRATLTFVMPGTSGVTVTSATGQNVAVTMSGSGAGLVSGRDPTFALLARETGGSVLPVSASSDLSAAFKQLLNDFRSAYVLYYNAREVEAGGYHTLEVKVNRPDLTVTSRRGYW